MLIIADANIWGAKHAFAHLAGLDVRLDILEHTDITPASVAQADVLLVRSSTKVNQALLQGSSVRFVGTATVGDDHIDKAYLAAQNICFASAAGSSTGSVVEYMLAVLLDLAEHQQLSLSKDSLGIIGVGRIGSLLQQACQKLGLQTLANDPPRQRQEENGQFHDLNYLLHHADILTLHTPLIRTGKDNTVHLLHAETLAKFQGKGIINAGRGACLDNAALLHWLQQDHSRFAVLDCWEHEPNINLDLLQHPQVSIATPHIAGHSLDGKAANTQYIYQALCDFLHIQGTWDMQAALPPIPPFQAPKHASKAQLASLFYPIQDDSQTMKQAAQQGEFRAWFQHYRRHYPVRRAWDCLLTPTQDFPTRLFF